MKEMVGGCCVCSDDRGWAENPLVYCDGQGCNVAVHQACYGIVTVPTGNWYCRKCESQERTVKVRCELCPSRDGALKPTDNNGWAHVVCALYIPEVRFGNVTTMEPIILHQIPQERFTKSCYICEESNKGSRANVGACMQCNKVGCRQQFHVTCAQSLGLLCEEAGNYLDNVKYCGYCHHHYTKLKKGGNVKPIPPYRPVSNDSPDASPSKEHDNLKTTSKRKLRGGKTPPMAQVSPDPSSSPRPLTPGAKLSSSSSSSNSSSSSSSSMAGGVVSSAGASAPAPPQLVAVQAPPAPLPGGPPPPPPPHQSQIPLPPSSSSAPLIPGQAPPVHPSVTNPSPPGSVVKPGSIVVQVPLEAAMGGGAAGSGPGSLAPPAPPPPPNTAASPPVLPTTPLEQSDIPAKRARSQSSEKSEKGRRSKRTSGSSSSSSSAVVGGSSSGGGASSTGAVSQPQAAKLTTQGPVMPTLPPSAVVHPTPSVVHHQVSSALANSNSTMGMKGTNSHDSHGDVQMSTSSSSSSHKSRKMVVKDEKDMKVFQNGVSTTAPHMLGNQLNPSSTMAQKMCDTLSQEVAAHSIFSTEPNLSSATNLVGPPLPKPPTSRGSNAGSGSGSSNHAPGGASNGGVTWNNSIPQSLDQLLERQWEQGSQFLMEQAQHFDIASLLSCLHQLRAENAQLEEHVNSLLARRDHLLAVNARLAIPLVTPANTATSGTPSGTGGRHHAPQGAPQAPNTATVAPHVVENGLATPAEQQQYLHRGPPPQASNPQPLRSSQGQGQQHNSGSFGGSGAGGGPAQSSVVVRASSGGSSTGSSAMAQAPVTSSSVVVPAQQPPDQHRRL